VVLTATDPTKIALWRGIGHNRELRWRIYSNTSAHTSGSINPSIEQKTSRILANFSLYLTVKARKFRPRAP
jgi:hypothetical protein